MKAIILTLFLHWCVILPAQNYENICPVGITLFRDINSNLKAFRHDSVHIPVNGDSLFFSYMAMRDTLTLAWDLICKDTSNGSVLGRKILKKADGWFYFYNRYNDTIKLNSTASVNSSWKYCLLAGGSYIQATITAIVTKNILGTNDLVKIITFQAKNSSNNNITNILNGKTIQLSQHFGLVKTMDIYYVSSDTTSYFLAGTTEPALGLQLISARDVYNFDTGDIFEYNRTIHYNPMGGYSEDRICKILTKTVYGNYDSIRYGEEICLRWTTWWPDGYGTYYDTSYTTYNLTQLSLLPVFNLLPDEFKRINAGFFMDIHLANNIYATTTNFNQRVTRGIDENKYIFDQGCWVNQLYDYDSTEEFTKNLGRTNIEYFGFEGPGITENLVYFKKGSETWGTPVATDCNTLVGVKNNFLSDENKIAILPNPAVRQVEIILNGHPGNEHLNITLYDSFGREVFHETYHSNPIFFYRPEVPDGCYILTIRDMSGDVTGRAKIIFN